MAWPHIDPANFKASDLLTMSWIELVYEAVDGFRIS